MRLDVAVDAREYREILEVSGPVPERTYLRRTLAQTEEVLRHMRARGHVAPILWCYNPRLAGVYATVVRTGTIRVGDRVRVLPHGLT